MLLWSDNEPKAHTFKTKKAPAELTEEAGRQSRRIGLATSCFLEAMRTKVEHDFAFVNPSKSYCAELSVQSHRHDSRCRLDRAVRLSPTQLE